MPLLTFIYIQINNSTGSIAMTDPSLQKVTSHVDLRRLPADGVQDLHHVDVSSFLGLSTEEVFVLPLHALVEAADGGAAVHHACSRIWRTLMQNGLPRTVLREEVQPHEHEGMLFTHQTTKTVGGNPCHLPQRIQHLKRRREWVDTIVDQTLSHLSGADFPRKGSSHLERSPRRQVLNHRRRETQVCVADARVPVHKSVFTLLLIEVSLKLSPSIFRHCFPSQECDYTQEYKKSIILSIVSISSTIHTYIFDLSL